MFPAYLPVPGGLCQPPGAKAGGGCGTGRGCYHVDSLLGGGITSTGHHAAFDIHLQYREVYKATCISGSPAFGICSKYNGPRKLNSLFIAPSLPIFNLLHLKSIEIICIA